MAIADRYPVSPGHALIIPRRHTESLFELSREERDDLMELLAQTRGRLLAELKPSGFNIGINDGQAAGQIAMHLHVHLIPWYQGDVSEAQGGIRWVFPAKADYWSSR
jgi:diadenosine tetraphosphate (Ap4A) HIT family hydrolase